MVFVESMYTAKPYQWTILRGQIMAYCILQWPGDCFQLRVQLIKLLTTLNSFKTCLSLSGACWTDPSHRIYPWNSPTMHFFPVLSVLARLVNTAYNTSLTKINSTDIATRDIYGYRSVAYFVNWVCVIHIRYQCITKTKRTWLGHLCSWFPASRYPRRATDTCSLRVCKCPSLWRGNPVR